MPKNFKSRVNWKALLLLIIFAVSSVTAIAAYALQNSGGGNPNPTSSPSVSPSPVPSPTENPEPTPNPSSSIVNPTPSPQVKIVNKQVPPGYTMGFQADGGLINGMNVAFIDNAAQKFSIRFTAKLGGVANQLVIYAFAYQGQPSIRVGLQEDNSGNPSGQWMNQTAFGNIQLSSSSGFKLVPLQASANIIQGMTYHIVIEQTENSTGTAAVETYQANSAAQPLNPNDPDTMWTDAKMNTLSYDGQGWQALNKWPIFVVTYTNGQMEGQPYSLLAQWVVWGATWVGQTIIPASDYKIGKIAFDVSLNSNGNIPQDKLYYQIRDANNAVLSQGLFAQPTQVTGTQSWVEADLPQPVVLTAGHLYRIVLMSPQTSLDNAYFLFGHEFSFDPSLGYGGVQHQLTSSLDGGASWGDNADADAVFRLTTVS